MSDLRELYQEMILDHGKRPRNYGKIEDTDHRAEGHNPLCGDTITVWIKVVEGRIEDVKFEGNGCAISTASASMMGEALRGMTVAEARQVFDSFHSLVTGEGDESPEEERKLGKLLVFRGVREFPVRVKCATLAWHTLRRALEEKDADEPVTTE
jgi:nitrogen fixation NifU-like protein